MQEKRTVTQLDDRRTGMRDEQDRSSSAFEFFNFGKEAVSKLKICQEKCDFHGRERAVADEIRVALRWRTCHANRISPI